MDAPTVEKRGPGRPKKEEMLSESSQNEILPKEKDYNLPTDVVTPALIESVVPSQVLDIKHIFRTISSYGVLDESLAIYPREVVEDYLRQNYFAQGYTLYKVEHLRTKVGAEGADLGEYMLYILVKYAQ